MTRFVGEYDTEAKAHIARLLLEQHGICAELVGGSLSGLEGWPVAYRGVQLLVADADFERARRILAGEEPGEA